MKKNLLILCFHGVTHSVKSDRIENFSRKHISKKIFERHIKYLIKQKCTFLSIDQKIKTYSQELPILENDTQNIIEYVKNTQKKKKKYYFWKLIDKND